MNQRELAERRVFDFRVLNDMRCSTFDFEAYRSMSDMRERKHAVTLTADAGGVSKYRWIFRIATHISRTKFAPQTEIGVNTDVTDYPHKPPNTWILSSHTPWSPHFMERAPVCIGDELWTPNGGQITLGELAIHIAHLLNWDEKGRGPGYVGWNGDSIAYHRQAYGGRPLSPDLIYPMLPSWLSAAAQVVPVFRILGCDQSGDHHFRVH